MEGLLKNKIIKAGLMLSPVLIVAAGLLVYSVLPKSNTVNMEGSVEISTSPYYSRVNGTVTEVPADTGEAIKAGDILSVVDSKAIENEMEQLKAALDIKNAKLKELSKDPKIEAVDAARRSAQDDVVVCEETLAAAKRSLDHAKRELETQRQLFQAGSVSQWELKNYEIAVEEGVSAVSIAAAQLDSAKNNIDTIEYPEINVNEMEAAQADVRLTQLQIEKLEAEKEDYVMKALKDGVVVSRSVDIGSNVIIGQSLFELSNEDDKFFVFYLPEEYINGMTFGDELDLYQLNSDTKIGTGKICYIDWKAIYTPKDFETSSNKSKRSIKIKALINSAESLRVGETIVTRIDNKG